VQLLGLAISSNFLVKLREEEKLKKGERRFFDNCYLLQSLTAVPKEEKPQPAGPYTPSLSALPLQVKQPS
jgi:hypothetical protein